MASLRRWHRCAGGIAASEIIFGKVVIIPELLAQHAAFISDSLECHDVRERVPSGSELVVATLAGEDRPRATHTRAIESRAVLLLTICIVVVASPARALRQFTPKNAINHLKRIDDDWIVGVANSKPNQVKKIAADNVARWMTTGAICELNFESVHIGWGSIAIGLAGVIRT